MDDSRIPAWKRLGLKLKYANERSEKQRDGDAATTHRQAVHELVREPREVSLEPPRKKRKPDTPSNGNRHHELDQRLPTSTSANGSNLREAHSKKVSFSDDTKPADKGVNGASTDHDPTEHPASTTAKKTKKKSNKKTQQPSQKLSTALEYLSQYHSARSNWKFNKNREIWILKHCFSESNIPRDYDIALAKYMHGLQGIGARERLKTQCTDLLREEDSFPMQDGTDESSKPGQVEQYAERLKHELNTTSAQDLEPDDGGIEEAGYQTWIRKQSRARIMLWALGIDKPFASNGKGSNDVTNATKSKAKKRKNRTAVVEYDSSSDSSSSSSSSSSSDSESESEDETSSSGSDEDSETNSEGGSSSSSDDERRDS